MLFFARFQQRLFSPAGFILYFSIVALIFIFIDRSLASRLHAIDFGMLQLLLRGMTQFGNQIIFFVALPLIALFFRYVRINRTIEMRVWFLWLCMVLTLLLCLVLKVFFGRARPELFFDMHAFGFYWFQFKQAYWSFPSGHTMTIMALMWGLCVLHPKKWLIFILFGLLVACMRILLLQHYLSDVLAGFFLSGLVVYRLKSTINLWHYTKS